MSCHQLFVLLFHAQQTVPALPQQLHSQRRLPGTRHARFLHLSSRTSSERAQELPTVPIFVTEKVHLGGERNRAIPTKWRTGSSRSCVGGSRHMVDWLTADPLTSHGTVLNKSDFGSQQSIVGHLHRWCSPQTEWSARSANDSWKRWLDEWWRRMETSVIQWWWTIFVRNWRCPSSDGISRVSVAAVHRTPGKSRVCL